MGAHINTAPPRPSTSVPGLPRALDAVVTLAMAKNPEDRHPSAGAFADAAQRALTDSPAVARPAAPSSTRRETAPPPAARRAPTLRAAARTLLGSRANAEKLARANQVWVNTVLAVLVAACVVVVLVLATMSAGH